MVDAEGDLVEDMAIPMPGMTMIHDMSLTENYAVIFDLPVTLSFVALGTGASFPFRWDNDHEPRVGLLPRDGEASDIIWSPITPNYAYHPMNAYEDAEGNVVIDIAPLRQDVRQRHPRPLRRQPAASGPLDDQSDRTARDRRHRRRAHAGISALPTLV